MERHVFKIEDGFETHYIVATTIPEAEELAEELYQIPAESEDKDQLIISRMNGFTPITIHVDNPGDEPEGWLPRGASVNGPKVTAQASNWAQSAKVGAMIGTTLEAGRPT